MKQKYFEKKVLNQKEIDEFWEGITSGKREKGSFLVPVDRESTKQFVTRISKWIIKSRIRVTSVPQTGQVNDEIKVYSIQYNENLSECVVIYEILKI